MQDQIFIKGARENNLKNIDVDIPRDKLVVLTGLSGSGKSSSLAFDTIYAEGQRRYVESLSSYARDVSGPDGQAGRGLHRRPVPGHLHRPEDHQQESALHRGHGHGDLRLSAPAVGAGRRAPLPQVRQGDPPARRWTRSSTRSWPCREGTRIQVMAPVVRAARASTQGAGGRPPLRLRPGAGRRQHLRADGGHPLDKNHKHHIEIVVDRLIIRPDIAAG